MRIGAFHRFSIFEDPSSVVEAIACDAHVIDRQGIDLAVFPEGYLQGHSYDQDVIRQRALTIDDAVVRSLVARLRNINATVIVGLFEKRGTEVFNSAMVFRRGIILGVYAKAVPIEEGCVAGRDFPVWTHQDWTFGVNICNDLTYPEVLDRLVHQGASLICAPINMTLRPKKADRWRIPALQNLQSAARRSRCWLISADVVGPGHENWMSYGCSAIISPDGTVMARAVELVEDVVVLDLP